VIRVEFAQAGGEDFARIVQHLLEHEAGSAQQRIQEIELGLRVLQHHPEIGRRLDSEHRELVLGQGSRGCAAKYRWPPDRELVLITALRSQKESGCRR
jgi:plasmid stabilization system protein ParE